MGQIKKKNIQPLIDATLKSVNFGRIRKVMLLLDWMWVQDDGDYATPSIADLKATATRLLRNAITDFSDGYDTFCSTGGFQASVARQDTGELSVQLLFVTEQSELYTNHKGKLL